MIDKSINSLSVDDLVYLENLLGQEFGNQDDSNPLNKKKTILRILNAVRFQKNILTRVSR